MQTLTFNTTTKIVRIINGPVGSSDTIKVYENVSTVKCSELGFYEVMRKESEESTSAIPVFRAPIANTNMIIIK
jgi:hypothetical protein